MALFVLWGLLDGVIEDDICNTISFILHKITILQMPELNITAWLIRLWKIRCVRVLHLPGFHGAGVVLARPLPSSIKNAETTAIDRNRKFPEIA
jgi:hypothetical protein